MGRSVTRYMSETINKCSNSDEECIRACVAMDTKVNKAIEDYRIKSNQPAPEKKENPTATVEEIKELMMRPMISDSEIAAQEFYANEQPNVEPKSSTYNGEER